MRLPDAPGAGTWPGVTACARGADCAGSRLAGFAAGPFSAGDFSVGAFAAGALAVGACAAGACAAGACASVAVTPATQSDAIKRTRTRLCVCDFTFARHRNQPQCILPSIHVVSAAVMSVSVFHAFAPTPIRPRTTARTRYSRAKRTKQTKRKWPRDEIPVLHLPPRLSCNPTQRRV
jgi:hypothetical protein